MGRRPRRPGRFPSDLGRRYGSVSGDLNPIHLSDPTAKLFGFPRAIAHGMWTKARCLAALHDRIPDALAVDVAVPQADTAAGDRGLCARAGWRGDSLLGSRRREGNAAPRGEPGAARMSVADRSTGLGLSALRVLAGSSLLDRVGLRDAAERAVFRASRDGFRASAAAGRTFKRVSRAGRPARQRPVSSSGLFDLVPTDEQQMIVEALGAFAAERLRPAAIDADAACAPPDGLAAQAAELGVALLGVPEELGGAMSERSSVTGVLAAEALAHGDVGLAVALLAPAGVATALARFGSAEQQATYLPAFTGDEVAAASARGARGRPALRPACPGDHRAAGARR